MHAGLQVVFSSAHLPIAQVLADQADGRPSSHSMSSADTAYMGALLDSRPAPQLDRLAQLLASVSGNPNPGSYPGRPPTPRAQAWAPGSDALPGSGNPGHGQQPMPGTSGFLALPMPSRTAAPSAQPLPGRTSGFPAFPIAPLLSEWADDALLALTETPSGSLVPGDLAAAPSEGFVPYRANTNTNPTRPACVRAAAGGSGTLGQGRGHGQGQPPGGCCPAPRAAPAPGRGARAGAPQPPAPSTNPSPGQGGTLELARAIMSPAAPVLAGYRPGTLPVRLTGAAPLLFNSSQVFSIA